jgi:hypothetical protein
MMMSYHAISDSPQLSSSFAPEGPTEAGFLVILSLRYKQCCLTTRNTILFFLFRFHLLRVTSQRQVVKSFTVTVQGKNGQAVSGLHSLGVKGDRKGRADTLYDLLHPMPFTMVSTGNWDARLMEGSLG